MMTMVRQVWLTIFGMLVMVLIGTAIAHVWTTRESLRTQLQLRNDDGAQALGLALSGQRANIDAMQQLAVAQFDNGQTRVLRLLRADGSVFFERAAPPLAARVPDWFARLLPIEVKPGVAPLSDGGRPSGSVQFASQTTWATDALWSGLLQMAAWLCGLASVAAALLALAVRSWRRPIDAAVAQAKALQERRFVIAAESGVPELRELTRSMNALVQRLQALFESHATQLNELRAQAHLDSVTGLLNRRQFIAQLGTSLSGERHRGAGLLLIRLRRLEAMNRRIGHDATDRLLAALGQVLQSYPQKVKGALAGRLSGADFALYLPASGIAGETAGSLLDALRGALARVDPSAELIIGGTELPHAVAAADALSLADRALAQAESGGPFVAEILPAVGQPGPVRSQQQWHNLLNDALQAGRITLAEFAVRGPDGALLHLDCPARLQFEANGPFEPASQWLAMAVRCRLVAQVDLAVLALALQAVRQDARPRCINVSAASLAMPGFVAAVHERLQAAPQAASMLSFDFVESALRHPARLREAAALWRRSGAQIGVEHAGADLRDLVELHALGLDYIKIDGAFVQGAATEPAVCELARGLVLLLRGMGLPLLAEAVQDEADLPVLWSLGFHGATGPAVQAA